MIAQDSVFCRGPRQPTVLNATCCRGDEKDWPAQVVNVSMSGFLIRCEDRALEQGDHLGVLFRSVDGLALVRWVRRKGNQLKAGVAWQDLAPRSVERLISLLFG